MIYTYGISKQVYYTKDHEWVDFHARHAYVGISDFKLSGIGAIQHVKLNMLSLNFKKNALLGVVFSKDYEIPFSMPIAGKLIDYNEFLMSNPSLLADKSLKNRWLVKISVTNDVCKDDLICESQYKDRYQTPVSL